MRQHCTSSKPRQLSLRVATRVLIGVFPGALCCIAYGQPVNDQDLAAKVQQLTETMTQVQKQMEQSQHELDQLRTQIAALQQQIGKSQPAEPEPSSAAQLAAAVDQIREQQTLQETQIATHEQAKVESESKYPVMVSGLVLLTGFVNRTQVNDPVSPSIALVGAGSTGASLQQTVLGLDARGPHLFGARTHADVRMDFAGATSSNSTGTNSYTAGAFRLRTAHATLQWQRSQAFAMLDHAIVAPNTPTSLTAVAVPALAWSGNLWTWNPQVGLTQDVVLPGSQRIRFQAALIDVMNPYPIYGVPGAAKSINLPSTAEMSRWPGVEGRLAVLSGAETSGLQLGVGGLFAPHLSVGGTRFNTSAGTLDFRIPITSHAEFSGSGYWGQALGGLGAGTFKDYVFGPNPLSVTGYSFLTLRNIGGWAQFKARANERLEFNAALGTDQVPASRLRPYAGDPTSYYLNLARNRTYTGNVIFSPSAYLIFSLEYRHIQSSPVDEYSETGDVIGIATGYRF